MREQLEGYSLQPGDEDILRAGHGRPGGSKEDCDCCGMQKAFGDNASDADNGRGVQ